MARVSVFTPSHDVTYLDQCYESLLAQTFTDWEWIVYLNGRAIWVCPDKNDTRVKRIPHLGRALNGVGDSKREAVARCSGELLVELDHDDLLMPDALAEVVRAFDQHPECSLVYSDFQQVRADGTPDSARFSEDHGWQYNGDTCRSFEPYPSAISYIWYGPNHIRAFRRSAYDAVGGYDASRDVLDDQDLFCRLYQHGAFCYVPKVLYKQRAHENNTQTRPDLNARIQSETVELYDRYVANNALAWARRRGLEAFDLGGAHNAVAGFTTVDLHDADITGDVIDVLSILPDDSVGVIRACDFLEHVPEKIRLMNECYRVLAHGGLLLSLTPSTDGRGAFQDPTHVAFWNENSFWYYTDANYAKYVPEITARFQVSRLCTTYPSTWHEENKISYVLANLVAAKDGPRLPGLLKW